LTFLPFLGHFALYRKYAKLLPWSVNCRKKEGEIRILPAEEDWGKVLDELAGCLREEPVQNYDFNLKIGSLYETR